MNSTPLLQLRPTTFFFFFFITLSVQLSSSADTDILLSFKNTLTDNNGALQNWVTGSNPCTGNKANWTGIICGENNTILGLGLENMNLSGSLSLENLSSLPRLRTLSFKNNSFDGEMPSIHRLRGLRSIYLSMNKFSGELPKNAFEGMGGLRRVHLWMNQFNGSIPESLTSLQRLVELRLDDNQFDGSLPELRQPGLVLVNVSNNNLSGEIPSSLSSSDPSLFTGNKDLCGAPLTVQCTKEMVSKKLSAPLVLSLAVVVIAVVLAIASVIIATQRHRKDKKEKFIVAGEIPSSAKQEDSSESINFSYANNSNEYEERTLAQEQGKLMFVREERERFEIEDLLKASAQVLGRGGLYSLGSSYKAIITNGPCMVVKRFRNMNQVRKDEFYEHMNNLGKLSHPNLLPYIAYYYRKKEKLFITHYIPNGSLAKLLHNNNTMLNWSTRLKILKGVTRALAYLHETQHMKKVTIPHGHLKSSNVLLDESFEPLLTDYGLEPVISQTQALQGMVVYKSPEFLQYGRANKKSDVWSLGILILELLTGKSPGNYERRGKGEDTNLVSWVKSVVSEEWTGEVFDGKMMRTRNSEGDMLKLLQIGLGCCECNLEKRWDLKRAVTDIMGLKNKDNNEDDSSFSLSDAGGERYYYSSTAMTDDDFSFTPNNLRPGYP
ncbi:Non-specific serine/threonine protein kinase protein [Dioscorea alata]|uniref:Non-specific serine/threonine protein kinase protein n=1 Tax=Dioscorea alata TaxID=55571 RepID=A0ACB7VKQ7_DIOAL|nr:Non-specific serine/threonine protein kinase protein [Dioscorea alata]